MSATGAAAARGEPRAVRLNPDTTNYYSKFHVYRRVRLQADPSRSG